LAQEFSQFGKIESIRFRSIAFSESIPRKVAFIEKKFHENRDSLIHQFVNYKKNSYENNQIKKIVTKNKFKQYSIYSHFLQIKNLLK
jgi:nucleolar protein 12